MAQPDHALAALAEHDAGHALTMRLQRLDDEIRQLLVEVDQALAGHVELLASLGRRSTGGWRDLPPGVIHAGTPTLH